MLCDPELLLVAFPVLMTTRDEVTLLDVFLLSLPMAIPPFKFSDLLRSICSMHDVDTVL
jgi:hypothetical protein